MKPTIQQRMDEGKCQLYKGWFEKHKGLGISRYQMKELIEDKNYIKKRIIAELRRNKVITLEKRRYFIKFDTLKELIQ